MLLMSLLLKMVTMMMMLLMNDDDDEDEDDDDDDDDGKCPPVTAPHASPGVRALHAAQLQRRRGGAAPWPCVRFI